MACAACYALQLVRGQRRVSGNRDYDGTVTVLAFVTRSGNTGGPIGHQVRDFITHGQARYLQNVTAAMVCLYQHPHGMAALLLRQYPRSRANSTFESISDHSCSAADVAFRHRSTRGGVDCLQHMLFPDMETEGIVQCAIPGLGDDGHNAGETFVGIRAAVDAPLDGGVANCANADRVGDHDRPIGHAEFIDDHHAGYLPGAVERKPACRNAATALFTQRKNGSDASAYRPFTNFERTIAFDDGGVSNLHPRHIGDCIPLARCSFERHTQVAGAVFGSGRSSCHQ